MQASSLQADSAGNIVGSGISTNVNIDTVSTFGLNLGQYTTSSWMNGYVGSITSDPTTGGDIANTFIGQSGGTISGSMTTSYVNELRINESQVSLTKQVYNPDGSSNAYGVSVDSSNTVHLGSASYNTSDNFVGYGTGFAVDSTANSTQTTGKLVLDSTQGLDANNGGITNAGAISGVTSLQATGDISTTSTASIGGLLTSNGIDNNNSGMANAGAVSGVTTLSASGDITSGGSVTALTVNSTGNTSVGGNLTVAGNTTQNGNQTVNGTSTFNGASTFNNGLTVANGVASFQNGASVSGGNLNMNNNRITNVAAGVAGTDAVNVNQLNWTNQNINNVSQVAYSGIASVSAIAGIPGLQGNKRYNLGLGYGNYHGQNAMAVGSNVRLMENLTAKASIGVLSTDVTTSVGVGLQFWKKTS